MQSKEEAERENLQEHKIACARGMVGHKSLALQQKVQKEIQKKKLEGNAISIRAVYISL